MESKMEYKELFKRISSCVSIYEATDNGNDFIFKDLDKATEKTEKIKRKDVIGKSVLEVFPGVKDFGLFDVFKRVYETGKSENHFISFYKDSKISGWRENFVYKLPNGDIVAVYNDLTEKKKAEEDLTKEHERLALAQKSSGAGVWDWNINTEKFNWSDEFYILFGLDLKKDTANFDTWLRVLHPDDRQSAELRINESIKEQKPLSNEYRIVLPSGKIRWINVLGNTIYDEHGKAERMSGICIDITEKKKAEEEIKSLAKFPEENPNLIGRVDYDGKLLYCNPAYKRIFNGNDYIPFKLKDAIKKIAAEKIFNQEDVEIEIDDRIFLFNLIPIKKESYINFYGRDITELKKVQENITASEAKYRELFNSAPVGIAVIDNEGTINSVNKAILSMGGIPKEEILGKNFTEIALLEPKDIPFYKEIFTKILQGKITKPFNTTWHNGQGEKITGEVSATLLKQNGKVKGFQLIVRDITESKKAEEALRESEENLQRAQRLAKIGSWKWIAATDTVQWSEELCLINGHDPKLPAPSFAEMSSFFTHESWGRLNEVVTKALNNGESYELDLDLIRTDGTIIKTIARAEVGYDTGGKVAGLHGTVQDITERKRMEESLRTSEEKFAKAFYSSPEGLTITNLDNGKLIEVNKSFTNIFGYSCEEIIGHTTLEFGMWKNQEDRARISNILKEEGSVRNEELEIRTKLGDIKTLLVSIELINFGGKTCMLSTSYDITDRKLAEAQILHLSFYDHLTGLYNRRFFEEEVKRLDTNRQLPLSFIMTDLNGLKIVNDAFGHTEGDKLLMEVAKILKKACRSDDILSRWGGDEFVIILPRTASKTADDIMQRIKKECAKTSGQKIPLSLAIGIATKTEEVQDVKLIIIDAESNMYKNKLIEKESLGSSILSALKQTLYEKSTETKEHTDRIQDLAIKLGKEVKLSSKQLDELSLLATLHDIGKVAIPETILLKEGSLTKKEWEVIKRHPEIGFNIASSSAQIAHIAQAILSCHENWDGSGYPQGLKGNLIPVISRIVLIVDAYDVMTNKRAYKKAMSKEDAIKELKRCAGTQFDTVLVEKFIEIISK